MASTAPVDVHLAGISRLGAEEVVVFSKPDCPTLKQLRKTLNGMGVEYRVRQISGGYFDAFLKASEEAIASIGDDSALAVNMSTDQSAELSAIEDAVRIQQYFFHRRNEKATCSGYRYHVKLSRPLRLDVAPFWNFHNQTHNDILEMLSTVEGAIGVTELWDMIRKKEEEVEGFEAFRKAFRDFRRWLKNAPCFSEKVEKGPKYKMHLK